MLLGFNLLLWTTHLTPDQFGLLEDLKKAGYDGVEIPLFEGTSEDYEKIGQALKDNGLRCTGVTIMPDAEHDCTSTDAAKREQALSHLKWSIDCLAAAGGELLCGPFYQPLGLFTGEPASVSERSNLVDVHKQAMAHANQKNIKLSVEPLNRFECHVLNTVEDSAEVVKAVADENYGLLYDTFHANIEEKDPVGVIESHIKQINHVHLSENDRGTPGKGHVPFLETLSMLKKVNYDGWYVIEAFGRAWPDIAAATKVWRELSTSSEEVYRFGQDFLREQYAKA